MRIYCGYLSAKVMDVGGVTSKGTKQLKIPGTDIRTGGEIV